MNPAFLILSSLVGIVAFIGGIVMVIRAIMKSVMATKENTKALQECHKIITDIGRKLESHTVRLAVLEDRISR